MIKLKNKKFINLIIVFIIFLTLMNIIMPCIVDAAKRKVEPLGGFDSKKEYNQYIMEGTDQTNLVMQDEYFEKYYKEFDATYPKFEDKYKGKEQWQWKDGYTSVVAEPTDEGNQYFTEKRTKYLEYLNSKEGVPDDAKPKSEQEKSEEKLKKEFINQIGGIGSGEVDFLGPIFSPICRLMVAVCDGVMNVIQGWMLPGSPKAIDGRYASPIVLDTILGNRVDYAKEIFFLKVQSIIPGTAPTKEYTDFSVEPIPIILYSPAAIFSNKIPALDINFLNTSAQVRNPLLETDQKKDELIDLLTDLDFKLGVWDVQFWLVKHNRDNQNWKDLRVEKEKMINELTDESLSTNQGNTARTLQPLVSKWYVALRNIAIVSLLIVLIYIGIRILVSTTGEEQAKYKTMIKEWVMALVLVITIHFIMVFLFAVVQIITNMLTNSNDLINGFKGDELMNIIRMQISAYARTQGWLSMMGYSIMYGTLVWYVVIFTWKYLKRTIYMAFLTIIAPLVTLTYPMDKIKDGKSQAFDMWFKEYFFNLMVQPIDLLLYTILVSSAIELATTNFIYALVAIGFISQAENFIKKMFGLGAEGGAGTGGFASGAAFSSLMSSAQKGSGKVSAALGGGDDKGSSSKGGGDKVRMSDTSGRSADSNAPKDLSAFGGMAGGSGNSFTPNNSIPKIPKTSQQMSKLGANNKPANIGGKSVRYNKEPLTGSSIGATRVKGELPGTLKTGIGTGNDSSNQLGSFGGAGALNEGALASGGAVANGGRRSPQVNSQRRKPFKNKVWNGIGSLRKRYINKNTGKKLGKLAVMGLGAGALGMIGVAAGLASDDYSNVLKMGALGAGGGAMLGKEAVDQTGAVVRGVGNIKDTYQQGYHGKDYNDKILNTKLDKEWFNSEETRSMYLNKYGDNWKVKRDEAQKLRKQGITEEKDIERAIKLKDKHPEFSVEEAGNIVNYAATRADLIREGGEEKEYQVILGLVGGDEQAAQKAMRGLKIDRNLETPKLAEASEPSEILEPVGIPEPLSGPEKKH